MPVRLRPAGTDGLTAPSRVDPASELTRWHPGLELVETWYTMDYHRSAWPAPIRVLRCLPSVRAQSKIGHFRVTTGRAAVAAAAYRDT